MSLAQLKKMKIVGYKDASFDPLKKTGQEYEVLINPENYSLNYETLVTIKNAQGSGLPEIKYNQQAPQVITFKFLFDGTGVIKKEGSDLLPGMAVPGLPSTKPDVAQDVEDFKKVAYYFQSGTHEPPFTQLQWGPLIYNCRLTKMTINYKLFNPDGSPLRAEADCTFNSIIDAEKQAAILNLQSPDLTHIRTVVEGDTLPLICYREYGESKYYFQVAQFNKLIDFKKLIPGIKLVLPPITKN